MKWKSNKNDSSWTWLGLNLSVNTISISSQAAGVRLSAISIKVWTRLHQSQPRTGTLRFTKPILRRLPRLQYAPLVVCVRLRSGRVRCICWTRDDRAAVRCPAELDPGSVCGSLRCGRNESSQRQRAVHLQNPQHNVFQDPGKKNKKNGNNLVIRKCQRRNEECVREPVYFLQVVSGLKFILEVQLGQCERRDTVETGTCLYQFQSEVSSSPFIPHGAV